jgi:hypothetical protein
LLLTALPRAASGLTLEFAVGTAATLTIVDNDGTDLNTDLGVIDFDLNVSPLDGVLAAKGRVFEAMEDIDTLVSITSDPPDTEGTIRNIGGTSASFTITVNSSAFALRGPPLGWAVFYNGQADDPTPNDVEVPDHSVTVYTDVSELLVSVPATAVPLTVPAGQPVDFAASSVGSNVTADAMTIHVVYAFTLGPGDRIRLPDNNLINKKGIQVNVFTQDEKCVDGMNNRARQIINKAAISDFKCVKALAKSGGNATACIDSPSDVNTDKKENALLSTFSERCNPVPAWGVDGGSCCEDSANDGVACGDDLDCSGGTCEAGACISHVAEAAVNDIAHDLFGGTAVIGAGEVGTCQKHVVQKAGKLLETRWKVFRKCKKENFTLIDMDPNHDAKLIMTCLGPPQPDSKPVNGKIAKKETTLKDAVSGQCLTQGVTPVGLEFPGACTSVADNAFADCVIARVKCRFCLAVNSADDIDPPLDCDLFDDANAGNNSCP